MAWDYVPREANGEIDLVGYGREALAFVEIRTQTAQQDQLALPELSVTEEKPHVVAIEEIPGRIAVIFDARERI